MVHAYLGPDYDLAHRLSAMERAIAQLSTRNALQNATIDQGGLTVTGGGSIDITGGGAAYVNGLRLSAVSSASSMANSSGGFAVSTSKTTIASAAVDVPSGFTQAIVTANASSWVACSNAAGDYFHVECYASASSTGAWDFQSTGAIAAQSGAGTLPGYAQYPQGFAPLAWTFTGLNGGTISAQCQVWSQNQAWSANGYNGGAVQLVCVFIP